MLEFQNDRLFILPYSRMIRSFIEATHLNKVYRSKNSPEAYLVYQLAYNLITKILESRYNMDVDYSEVFQSVMEEYVHAAKEFQDPIFGEQIHIRNILGDEVLMEKIYRGFLKDVELLGGCLDDLKLTEISAPLDVHRITYDNIYITIINLKIRRQNGD